jgi:hypothetical protein
MIKHVTLPLLLAAGFASAEGRKKSASYVNPRFLADIDEDKKLVTATQTVTPSSDAVKESFRTVTYKIDMVDGDTAAYADAVFGDDADENGLMLDAIVDAILEGEDPDGEKIVSITADFLDGEAFVQSTTPEPARKKRMMSTSGEYSTTITIVYGEAPEIILESDMYDYFYDTADDDTIEFEFESFGTDPLKGYGWTAEGDAEVDADAVDEEYRTVEYEMTFTSNVDLDGEENLWSSELAPALLDLDSGSVAVEISATTLAVKSTAARRLRADEEEEKTYTYSSTVSVVYTSVDASKLDLGLPKETDKGLAKVLDALKEAAVAAEYDVEDDAADNYVELEVTAFARTTPLVTGATASRDLTTSADAEADRTLTVSAEFTSTKQFTTTQITSLEGQISSEMIALDTADNILSVETDVTEQAAAAAARRLLQTTYTYDSVSTLIAVSKDAASDAKTLLGESLDAATFKTILDDAASAAGIEATFTVDKAPGIEGGAAASSGASAAILGGALGLFAAVAALL